MPKRKAPPADDTGSGGGGGSNANEALMKMLLELAEFEKNVTRQIHKYNAYRKAANSISKHPTEIKSGEDAKDIEGVGEKIRKKIDEFMKTGKLEKLEKIRVDDTSVALKELTRVHGIGPAFAQKLLKEKITSIDELRKHADLLNDAQKIGLKYLEEFEQRIPRAEMEKLEEFVVKAVRELDEEFEVTVCGSYRRGAKTSGDIDVLMTHPSFTSKTSKEKIEEEHLLDNVVEKLEEIDFVTDRLALGDAKFMGVCILPEADEEAEEDEPSASAGKPKKCLHRRIDIRLMPIDEYWCGVLYFTGSDEFNRQMRAHALDLGFTLNEYSLRKVGSTKKPGEPLPIKSEQDIFDYLDMKYKEPNERSV